MSDELKKALTVIEKNFAENPSLPTYLHSGPEEPPFAVLLPLSLDPTEADTNHTHLSGDEDDEWEEGT